MPVEGSKPHIGRNLGLDLGNYIQGKSFTRSVSISEPVPDESNCSATPDGKMPSSAFPGPSGRFASGGSAAQPSPSPLSSATATISPDSPLPSVTSSPYPSDSNPHPLSRTNLTAVLSDSISNDTSELSDAFVNNVNSSPALPSVNSSQLYSSELQALLENPSCRKTLNLLSQLIDSRLTPQWRDTLNSSTLISRRRLSGSVIYSNGPTSSSPGITSAPPGDVTDASSSSIRRPIPPTPSPSEEVSIVKRFRPDDSAPVEFVQPRLTKSRSDPRPLPDDAPTSFVSPSLTSCVVRLANHFESRYHDKLGSLLEDVARLSQPDAGESGADKSSETVESSEVPELDRLLLAVRDRFHLVLKELFADRVNWGRVVAMLAFLRALCEHTENSVTVEEDSATEPVSSSDPTDTDGPSPASSSAATSSVPEPQEPGRDAVVEEPDSASNSGIKAAHYVIWTTEYIHGLDGIWGWISTNGGWEGLLKFESERGLGDLGNDRLAGGLLEDDTIRLLRRAVTGVTTLAVGAVGLMAAFHYLSKRF